jgi:hypothetical protein
MLLKDISLAMPVLHHCHSTTTLMSSSFIPSLRGNDTLLVTSSSRRIQIVVPIMVLVYFAFFHFILHEAWALASLLASRPQYNMDVSLPPAKIVGLCCVDVFLHTSMFPPCVSLDERMLFECHGYHSTIARLKPIVLPK